MKENKITPRRELPDIIDNDSEGNLLTYLKLLLKESFRARIASGYFYLNGFDLVKEDLKHFSVQNDPEYEEKYQTKSPFLLIIGDETNVSTKKEIDEGFQELSYILRSDDTPLTENQILKLDNLRDFIKNQIVDVRVYNKEKFHSKVYILDKGQSFVEKTGIIGSSNFTRPGLTQNSELNSTHRQTSPLTLIEDWFHKKWINALPYSSELIKVIESLPEHQKYVKKSKYIYLSPLDFIKTLIKQFGKEHFLNRDNVLLPFQIADYKLSKEVLQKYGGVILAHSVGLGKSFVASRIIQDYINDRKRVLLIAPPTLWSEDNWKGYLINGFKINPARIQFLSLYQLSNEKFNPKKYSNFDLIVIDEAHHFRNGSKTTRYKNLKKMYNPKSEFVLITATPVNNSPMDLKNIIDIFKDEQRFKKDNLILNYNALEQYSKKRQSKKGEVTEEDYSFIQKNVSDLTKKLIVKTTRKDLKKMYGEGLILKGKTIKFVDPITTQINYTLEHEIYTWIFKNIVNFLTNLYLPHLTVINPATGGFLEGLYKLLLYKRLESSIHAFYQSILNLKNKEKKFLGLLEKMSLQEIRTFEKEELVKHMNKNSEDATLFQYIDDEDLPKSEKIQKREIQRQIKTDLVEIDKLIKKLEQLIIPGKKRMDSRKKLIFKYHDDKLKELIEKQLPKYKGKKILLFTQFLDTAEYLWANLQHLENKDFKIELITGMVPNKAPIIERFKKNKDIKLLIATDAISEGVNIAEADVVINYDLPWSVLTLIQRQGRTLRLESDKQIHVGNFIPDKKIDLEINLVTNLKKKITDIIYIIGLEFALFSPEEAELIKKLEKEGKDIPRLQEKILAMRMNNLDDLEQGSATSKLSNFDMFLQRTIEKYDIQDKDLKNISMPEKIFYTKIKSSRKGKLFLYEMEFSDKLSTDHSIKYQTPNNELDDDFTPMWDDLTKIDDGTISDIDREDIGTFEEHISDKKIETITSYSEAQGKQQAVEKLKKEIFDFTSKEIKFGKSHSTLDDSESKNVSKLKELLSLFQEKNPSESHVPMLREFKKNRIKLGKHGSDAYTKDLEKLVKNLEKTARDLVTYQDIDARLLGFVIES